jgi:hypothetical protein
MNDNELASMVIVHVFEIALATGVLGIALLVGIFVWARRRWKRKK